MTIRSPHKLSERKRKDPDTIYSDKLTKNIKRKNRNDLRKVKCYSKKEWSQMINRFFQMTYSELEEFLDPQRRRAKQCSELIIGSIIAHAISRGDHDRLDFLLNRTIGKIVDKHEVQIAEPFIMEKLDGSQLVMGTEVKAKTEDENDGEVIDAVFYSGDRKQLEGQE